MSKFCDDCNNLMEITNSNNYLNFICKSCEIVKKIEPEDTLRYAESKKNTSQLSSILLRKAVHDRTNPIKKNKCPKCKYDLAKQIRTKNEMILINICLKCEHNWI